MDIKNLAEVPAFITKDGSEIRELLAHRNSAIRQSKPFAEARLQRSSARARKNIITPKPKRSITSPMAPAACASKTKYAM